MVSLNDTLFPLHSFYPSYLEANASKNMAKVSQYLTKEVFSDNRQVVPLKDTFLFLLTGKQGKKTFKNMV